MNKNLLKVTGVEDLHSYKKKIKIRDVKRELFAYHGVKISSINLTGIKVMVEEKPIGEA